VPEGLFGRQFQRQTEKNGGNVRLSAIRLQSLPRRSAERCAFHRFDARSDRYNANQTFVFLDSFHLRRSIAPKTQITSSLSTSSFYISDPGGSGLPSVQIPYEFSPVDDSCSRGRFAELVCASHALTFGLDSQCVKRRSQNAFRCVSRFLSSRDDNRV